MTPEKPKSSEYQQLFAYYLKLLKPHFNIEIIYSGAVKAKTASKESIEQALKKEAQNFDKKCKPNDKVILLSEFGNNYSTPDLLQTFNSWIEQEGRVVFILGSAYGLHKSLYSPQRVRLSLSQLTFPHELALVIFSEQLYRLTTLRIGKRYHY
jgi:23S rRNA (pseudouridine1915-N3)-methyltransferase